MKTPSERTLLKIFAELEKEAYDKEYHTYDYKRTNQIIRANIESLFVAKNISINPPVIGRSELLIDFLSFYAKKFEMTFTDDFIKRQVDAYEKINQ